MSHSAPEDNIPSTGEGNSPPQLPTPMTLTPLGTSPRDSFTASANHLVPEKSGEEGLEEDVFVVQPERRKSLFKRRVFWLVAIAAVVVVIVAVIVPVYFTVIKPKNNTVSGGSKNPDQSSSQPSPTSGPGSPKSPKGLTTGGDGSTVTTDNGTEFTYHNPFGGFWVSDPEHPFNDNAQPNSWTPPLNTTWKWGVNQLYGVNIGGWFVLEPFITPALYQKYPGAIDEWTISTLMAADTASGGLGQLETHYDTFISEQDFAEIAGAGLNWIRLPIPWWAIEVWDGEPFLPRTSWKYILRAFQWARKYGLRIMIDLHTAPGSQNGYNHSGKKNVINFLHGPMGFANAQRMVNYIRIFTEFIAQPEYANVVPVFGIINEVLDSVVGVESVASFDVEVYQVIRAITGVGEGKGPVIAINDGASGYTPWAGLFPNTDRVAMDLHPYFAFSGQPNSDPINVPAPDGQMGGVWPGMACSAWKPNMVDSQKNFGITIGGEYSAGFNDCGFYLRSVEPYTPNNPDCGFWDDWQHWDQATKDGVLNFVLASMDAVENPFFWTWKIGNMANGSIGSPLWSYKLGLDNGWIPTDPRKSQGKCAGLGVNAKFDGTYLPWQTGGDGAGNIPATLTVSYPWPPATISGAGGPPSLLPQYTPTGSISTLPPPTFTGTKVSIDGWYDNGDTMPAPTPIPGCAYPNAWGDSYPVNLPIAGCSPGS